MKIAIVYDMIYPFNIGGAELRNYEIAKRLAKKHEVHLFGVKLWKGPDIIKKEGITLHGVCRYKKLYSFSGKRTIFEPINFAIKLFKPLNSEKFGIIDTSSFVYFHCFTCKLVSILKKTPLVFTWHQYWGGYWHSYLGKLKGFFGKIIEKSVKNLTKNHIAISQTTKKQLINEGVKEKNIFVNYDGIDMDKINSINPIKTRREMYDIIFVGRLTHQKNVPLLIQSVGLLKKEFPSIKVNIIGDGPERKKLESLTKGLNLEKNVAFTGFLKKQEDVYKEMKSSKIFVLPSLLEGFGIVVVEAMACGLPTIVVNNEMSASKELISDRYKNQLIVKNNPRSLAIAIKELLKNENLRKQINKEDKKNLQKFDWNCITKELEEYYLNIIKKWKTQQKQN
ncbi:MAG: glycosyltransferase family 4 protein [Nanoarchaeota archaeon]|nr:glycosyltransferase family 4 protein [Nanoarchaeota archaeon]